MEAGAILLDWDRDLKLICKGSNPMYVIVGTYLIDCISTILASIGLFNDTSGSLSGSGSRMMLMTSRESLGENPWTTINTSSPINLLEDIGYQPPVPVMNTAVIQSNLSRNFTMRFPTVDSSKSFQYQCSCTLLNWNNSRAFSPDNLTSF